MTSPDSRFATLLAIKAPRIPASTSPLPAVASAGFAGGVCQMLPAGSAIVVTFPLSKTTCPVLSAANLAASIGDFSTTSLGQFSPSRVSRRDNSPACGVKIAFALRFLKSTNSSAPASITACLASTRCDCTARACSSLKSAGTPEPTTQACARPSWTTTSGRTSSSIRPTDSGPIQRTMPTPVRMAAVTPRMAAPG